MGLSKQHLCMGRSECRLKFETGIELHEIQRHVISMGSCSSSFSAFQRALAPSTCIRLCWQMLAPPPSSQPLSHSDIPSDYLQRLCLPMLALRHSLHLVLCQLCFAHACRCRPLAHSLIDALPCGSLPRLRLLLSSPLCSSAALLPPERAASARPSPS